MDPKPEDEIVPIARKSFGVMGKIVKLLCNHFVAIPGSVNSQFYHYKVSLFYEDGNRVVGESIRRKVVDKALDHMNILFVYDGLQNLFTIGIMIEGVMKIHTEVLNKKFKLVIRYLDLICISAIEDVLRALENESTMFTKALQILNTALQQYATKQGRLLVRQSLDDPNKIVNERRSVIICRGLHSSFRTAQQGLSLNIDIPKVTLIRKGSVSDFLIYDQSARNINSIDWTKAKHSLKNLRIKASPKNHVFKVTGLTNESCREKKFTHKMRKVESEMTVYEYFTSTYNINLNNSADLPCIIVGNDKRPAYFPIELCTLVSLQYYPERLQRSPVWQKPHDKLDALEIDVKNSSYGKEVVLRSSGVSPGDTPTLVQGRILPAPSVQIGNERELIPFKGNWNFNDRGKVFVDAKHIQNWVCVTFSKMWPERFVGDFVSKLTRVGVLNEVMVEPPIGIYEEYSNVLGPVERVDKVLKRILREENIQPTFILCFLPRVKRCELYGVWMIKCLSEQGIRTQCIFPNNADQRYLASLLLKINIKLGGLNFELEKTVSLRLAKPTLIMGIDVNHGPPKRPDIRSIAAVVSSRTWPSICRYKAFFRTQTPRHEIIDSFCELPLGGGKDTGIMQEVLLDFYQSSNGVKPQHIIIFRDGVSDSQFDQVLNTELRKIIQACELMDENWYPKFTVIVAQKKNKAHFSTLDSPNENVAPGTIVDNAVRRPKHNDFYFYAHDGKAGKSKPVHYNILFDEVGFSRDGLQELVNALSYASQRSTRSTSIVAPIFYAHSAANQMGSWIMASSSQTCDDPSLPPLPDGVKDTMFFC